MDQTEKEAFFKTVDCHFLPDSLEIEGLKALIDRESERESSIIAPYYRGLLLWVSCKAFTYGVNVGIARERARRKAGGKHDY